MGGLACERGDRERLGERQVEQRSPQVPRLMGNDLEVVDGAGRASNGVGAGEALEAKGHKASHVRVVGETDQLAWTSSRGMASRCPLGTIAAALGISERAVEGRLKTMRGVCRARMVRLGLVPGGGCVAPPRCRHPPRCHPEAEGRGTPRVKRSRDRGVPRAASRRSG